MVPRNSLAVCGVIVPLPLRILPVLLAGAYIPTLHGDQYYCTGTSEHRTYFSHENIVYGKVLQLTFRMKISCMERCYEVLEKTPALKQRQIGK